MCLIGIAIAVTLGPWLDYGEFWWPDEARHAMDGVYVMDALRDQPVTNLYEYTVEYFARYPALGLAWYPPFFALIESAVLAVFEISEFSARLTVLAFSLAGLAGWYLWTRTIWGRVVGLLSALLLAFNPNVVLWSRSVMLEVPATAMVILSVFTFERYLRRPAIKSALVSGAFIAGMLLTKQTTAFILPAFFLYPVLTGRASALRSGPSLLAYVQVFTAIGFLTAHALLVGHLGLEALKGAYVEAGMSSARWTFERWTEAPGILLDAYGWPVLALSAAGAVSMAIGRFRGGDVLILLWIGSWYVCFTWFTGGEELLRYSAYLTPAMSLLAVRPLAEPQAYTWLRHSLTASTFAVVAWTGYRGLEFTQPFVTGYSNVAEFALSQPNRGTMLFCCANDGNFVMHVRRQDSARKEIVLRADKILVSLAVNKAFGVYSHVESEADILEKLDRYGVGIIVAESRDLIGLPELELFLRTLGGDRFSLLGEFPVDTNYAEFQNLQVRVYRYLDQKPLTAGAAFPMPHIGREVRLPARD